MIRALVISVLAVAIAGCGGDAKPEAAKRARAPEVVYLYRVLGDDPRPDSVIVRADSTAEVRRGGGHGGFRTVEMALTPAESARLTRLTEHAPWKALDGRTVDPGGFGGWDNDMRYMVRRGDRTITVTAADMPRSLRPLIHALDRIIEGDMGHEVSSTLYSNFNAAIDP